jgi:hypothetical protein
LSSSVVGKPKKKKQQKTNMYRRFVQAWASNKRKSKSIDKSPCPLKGRLRSVKHFFFLSFLSSSLADVWRPANIFYFHAKTRKCKEEKELYICPAAVPR